MADLLGGEVHDATDLPPDELRRIIPVGDLGRRGANAQFGPQIDAQPDGGLAGIFERVGLEDLAYAHVHPGKLSPGKRGSFRGIFRVQRVHGRKLRPS